MIISEPEWWDEWTFFDKETMSTKLKEEAPEAVQREWEEVQSLSELSGENDRG